MGKNHRFKLSDMVPNAWFYKLKLDMNTTTNLPNCNDNNDSSLPSTKKTHQHHPPAGASLPRKSYHFPRDLSPSLPDPPRKSSKQVRSLTKSRNKPAMASSAPRKPFYRTEDDSGSPDSIFRLDRVLTSESLSSCGPRPVDPVFDDPDIVIYVDENSFVRKPERAMGNSSFELLPNFELPRIVTKPAKPKHSNNTDHVEAEQLETKKPTKKAGENRSRKSGSRRCSVSSSPRPRLRMRSPRLAGRTIAQARRMGPGTSGSGTTSARKKLSGSFAVVKSSLDPKRDFRESMVEMIVEHNLKASKDLEELLACYLYLNTDEYHELIIEVFTQIWFDLTGLRSRGGFH